MEWNLSLRDSPTDQTGLLGWAHGQKFRFFRPIFRRNIVFSVSLEKKNAQKFRLSDFSRLFPINSDKFRYFSDFFRYFSEIFRFFHSFFLLLFCFKNLKKLFLVGFEPTQNAWKWHTPTTKPLIALIICSANFFYIILLFLFYIITYNIFKSNINFKMKRSKIILFKNLKL